MRLSTSTNLLYTRRDRSGFIGVSACLSLAARAGFTCFDLNGCDNTKPGHRLALDDWEAWAQAIRRYADGLGVSFGQSHLPIYNICAPDNVDDWAWKEELSRRTLVASGLLGVEWVVVHAGTAYTQGVYDRCKTLDTNAQYLHDLARRAVACGCKGIAVENVPPAAGGKSLPPTVCATTDGLIELVDLVNSPHVGICWDFGHAHLTRESQPESLRRIGCRLKATHVQDNGGISDEHTLPFRGTIPWESVMPVLGEIGYQGDFTYEMQNYLKDVPPALYLPALTFARMTGEHLIALSKNNENK